MTDLERIRARAEEIGAELQEIEERRSVLVAENEELAIAARVLTRLAEDRPLPTFNLGTPQASKVGMDDRGKPEGTPTVPDMIISVLGDAKANGFRGLEPKQMRVMIANKWWPEIPGETVNSIAWRMWKREQVDKDGPVYMLRKYNEGSGPSGPTEPSTQN